MHACAYYGRSGRGTIGHNSCNQQTTDLAGTCAYNGYFRVGHGYIGNDSCNDGDEKTCLNNGYDRESNKGSKGSILDHACNAVGACWNNKGLIGNDCCNYINACQNNTVVIKEGHPDCER